LEKDPHGVKKIWNQEYFGELSSGLILSNQLNAKITDELNKTYVNNQLKNKALKKNVQTLPSGSQKIEYSSIINQVFGVTSLMSPEHLKSFILNPQDSTLNSLEGDEGKETQTANLYKKKGEQAYEIPNALENVKHQNLIIESSGKSSIEIIDEDRLNLCFALYAMNLKLEENLHKHAYESAKDTYSESRQTHVIKEDVFLENVLQLYKKDSSVENNIKLMATTLKVFTKSFTKAIEDKNSESVLSYISNSEELINCISQQSDLEKNACKEDVETYECFKIITFNLISLIKSGKAGDQILPLATL
jgi:hypothetical protein